MGYHDTGRTYHGGRSADSISKPALRSALHAGQQRTPAGRHFPPFRGPEKPAYWLYQLSSAALLLGPFFASVHTAPAPLFWSGAALYAFGLLLLLLSVIGFAAPSESGVRHKGVYRISRNPMYVSYFFVFLGCVLLTQSLPLLAALLVFQLTAHTVIRAEERWCRQTFGAAYERYCGSVRRYL